MWDVLNFNFSPPIKIRGVDWFPLFTMTLTAFTICWVYVAFSLVSIKAQIRLKNAKYTKRKKGPVDHDSSNLNVTSEEGLQTAM